MDNDDKLTFKERLELVIEAGIASIPAVGSALQTLYYGSKNEKRFKRVENFYQDLSVEIATIKDQLPDVYETEYSDEAIGILETINDEVEKAASQSKIQNYKKAYKNMLLKINEKHFDEEKYFVRMLSDLTEFELRILFISNQNVHRKVARGDFYDADKSNIDFVDGNLNRLSDLGLLRITFGELLSGGNGSYIRKDYVVSDLGSRFISFIFE